MGEVQSLGDGIRHLIAMGESPVLAARALGCPVRTVMLWKAWQRVREDVEEAIMQDELTDDRVVEI